eukprot:TRINITY_DN1978_c0_g1_i2.p1 TRINITY_DN1978_c0_g1~~TRINITY_DN1978_c0_g1_i2.p1  ORF type:complete len:858 (+),score=164.17 TRINITY_DN1978_c0_g1_i2:68-2575(+)
MAEDHEEGHHGPSVIPKAIAGHALPSDFLERPLLVASRDQNQDVLRALLKRRNASTLPPQPDLKAAKRRAPKAVFVDQLEARMVELSTYFLRPQSYIHHNETLPDEVEIEDGRVEYEADALDEAWLRKHNSLQDNTRHQLNLTYFERVMDRLEKEAFLHAERTSQMIALEGDIDDHEFIEESDCCVCQEGLSEDTNQIIFCDGCDIAVHQCCYGVSVIPEGEWYCDLCKSNNTVPVPDQACFLCGKTGGAMKCILRDESEGSEESEEDEWLHIQCAYYLPEITFEYPDCGGSPYYIEQFSRRRRELKCSLCNYRKGAAVQCSKSSCCTGFHVTCGQMQRYCFTLVDRGKKDKESWVTQQFCERHTPADYLEKRAELLQKDAQLAELNRHKEKLREEATEVSQRSRKGAEGANGFTKRALISDKMKFCGGLDLKAVQSRLRADFRPQLVTAVFEYWEARRVKRRGMALLKRFTPSILNSGLRDTDAGTMRCSTTRKMVQRDDLHLIIPPLKAWRHQLEQARMLLSLQKRRENMKFEYIENFRNLFDAVHFPQQRAFRSALEALVIEDSDHFFLMPVDLSEVPSYSYHIKTPMDFHTIETKIDAVQYSSLAEFMSDVRLVFRNAKSFNRPGSRIYREADRINSVVSRWNFNDFYSPEAPESESEPEKVGGRKRKGRRRKTKRKRQRKEPVGKDGEFPLKRPRTPSDSSAPAGEKRSRKRRRPNSSTVATAADIPTSTLTTPKRSRKQFPAPRPSSTRVRTPSSKVRGIYQLDDQRLVASTLNLNLNASPSNPTPNPSPTPTSGTVTEPTPSATPSTSPTPEPVTVAESPPSTAEPVV